MHSLTKYIGGHGTSIGGIIVDGGNFDWIKDRKRQPLLNEPDQSYHGAVWADAVPQLTGANIHLLLEQGGFIRDLGAPLSPFNAFQIIQGWKLLALRMKQHCSNAESCEFLRQSQKSKRLSIQLIIKVKLEIELKNMQGGLDLL